MENETKNKEKSPFPHRKLLLLLAALCGIALLLFGSGKWTGQPTAPAESTDTPQSVLSDYAHTLEKEIAEACSKVRGVSQVSVLVSLDGDFENVYAMDEDTTQRDGTLQSAKHYVTVGSGSNEQTILLSRKFPRVTGIGIVCVGGSDPSVRAELTALLCATFGLGANKIYITEAKSAN